MGRDLRGDARDLDLVVPQQGQLLEASRRREPAGAGGPRRRPDRRRHQRRAPRNSDDPALGRALRERPHPGPARLGGPSRGRLRDDPLPRAGAPPAALLRAPEGALPGRRDRPRIPGPLRGRPLLPQLPARRPDRVRPSAGAVGVASHGRAGDRLQPLPAAKARSSSARRGASTECRRNANTSSPEATSEASRSPHGRSCSSEYSRRRR